MVGVAPDEGVKRRLPSWMLGATAADQVRSNDGGKGNLPRKQEVSVQACTSKVKAPRRQPKATTLPCQEECSGANSCHGEKGESRRRKRVSSREDFKYNGNISETVSQKKLNGQGEVRETASAKKKKLRIATSEIARDLDISPDDDDCDADLTVEDLLSIAQEYVKAADKDKSFQQLSNGESEAERSLLSFSSKNDLGSSINADTSIPRTHETTANTSTNLTAEQPIVKTIKTGDPAQDMLDILFGSLLKKPVEKEKNTSFIANSVAFDCEIERLSQSNVAGEEMAALKVKKKSSLKDKVAMLLD